MDIRSCCWPYHCLPCHNSNQRHFQLTQQYAQHESTNHAISIWQSLISNSSWLVDVWVRCVRSTCYIYCNEKSGMGSRESNTLYWAEQNSCLNKLAMVINYLTFILLSEHDCRRSNSYSGIQESINQSLQLTVIMFSDTIYSLLCV